MTGAFDLTFRPIRIVRGTMSEFVTLFRQFLYRDLAFIAGGVIALASLKMLFEAALTGSVLTRTACSCRFHCSYRVRPLDTPFKTWVRS